MAKKPPSGALKPAVPEQPRVPEGLGVYGARKPVSDIYLFGTEAEIRNRNATGYNVSGTPPENAAPRFEQIQPGPTGQSANEPTFKAYGGASPLKFGNAKRYAG